MKMDNSSSSSFSLIFPPHLLVVVSHLALSLSQGRPIDDIEHYGFPIWPDMQDLINHCLQYVAIMRPSAQQVFDRLCSADFVSLKRAIPVEHDRSVETFTIRVRTTYSQIRPVSSWNVYCILCMQDPHKLF